MAVPPTTTITNLSGTYTLNKSLSDSVQPMLRMQNVGFLVRKALDYSSVTVTLKQYTDAEGKVHLDQTQVLTGGLSNSEERVLDDEWREVENKIWGKVKGRSSLIKLSEADDGFLAEGWLDESRDGEVIEQINESVTDTWAVRQIWGFAEVQGQRRQVRRIVSKKGDQIETARTVYDWKA